MTKPEMGMKRLCAHCGGRFYDLLRTPIVCPKCGTEFEPPKVKTRFEKTPEPKLEAEQSADAPEFVPIEDADADADTEDEGELNGAVLVDEHDEGDGDLDVSVGDDDAEGEEES
jgi:uncharacterized protein (TIGR02300 family)